MRKGKQNTNHDEVRNNPAMKVINLDLNSSQVEKEIDRYVKHIHWLIRKLQPVDRQKYYNGLLSYILSEPVDVQMKMVQQKYPPQHDYSNLSQDHLVLIRELSVKMEELYRTMES